MRNLERSLEKSHLDGLIRLLHRKEEGEIVLKLIDECSDLKVIQFSSSLKIRISIL